MGKNSNQDEEMTVTLTLDDGDVTCAIYTILEVNDKDYIVLMPLDENGEFKTVNLFGNSYSGKALYDVLEYYARKGFIAPRDSEEKKMGQDILWYIWCNQNSPVFGKDKMTTFERYFVADKETHHEKKNAYYRLYDREDIVNKILEEEEKRTRTQP